MDKSVKIAIGVSATMLTVLAVILAINIRKKKKAGRRYAKR